VTFQGAWLRKFDWRGELLNVGQVMAWNPLTTKDPSGKMVYVQGGNSAFRRQARMASPGTHHPWKPNGTRRGRSTSAIGPRSRRSDSNTASTLVSAT
jgi:hypothetical protein